MVDSKKSKHVIHSYFREEYQVDVNQEDSKKIAEYFEPTHLDDLFQMVRCLQAKIIKDDGEFLEGVTTRDLSSLIGSISALLRSFGTYEEKLNSAAEISHLRYVVTECILKAPQEIQEAFFKQMDAYPEYEELRRRSHQYWRQKRTPLPLADSL